MPEKRWAEAQLQYTILGDRCSETLHKTHAEGVDGEDGKDDCK